MRVLWFSNSMANADEYFKKELTGTGGWLKSLDKELQKKVDLHVVFHFGYKNAEVFKYKETTYYPIKKNKNKIHKYWSMLTNKTFDTEFKEKYIQIIQKVKPDIIHIHGTENLFGCIIGETEIPVVISIQGNLTVISHKYCSGIEKNYMKIAKFNKYFFYRTFLRTYKKMLKMAEVEKKYLKKSKYVIGRTRWDYRITRILSQDSHYYHCDEILRQDFYQNIWSKKNKDKFVIMTTSDNRFYKGFETICESISLLNSIGLNFEWRVAGIEKDDLINKVVKKKMKSKYPQIGLILLGRIPSDKLIENLLDSNVYVMPSHIENSPNNLCEAMILGMPCIATYAGGTGSIIQDGENGILIQDGDPWGMAGAIMDVKNDYDLALKYGSIARAAANRRHDKMNIVNRLFKIYEEIIYDFKSN